MLLGGVFFAADLASWHLGIELTRLGNATLFGNSGSILLVAWGLFALRRMPHRNEWLAFAAAIAGSAILLGRSLEIDRTTLIGDLLCLLAGFLYTFYILIAQRARNAGRLVAAVLVEPGGLAGAGGIPPCWANRSGRTTGGRWWRWRLPAS
ncbi:hypothetical protein [Novosphingobium sp.]|uniref:hypothetical protein n=1 Tax=Novosphingobium sp. TaxID=1874826 RepID=UPI0025E72AA0|nr:hypothetical protein [Novosphingobium sp.]